MQAIDISFVIASWNARQYLLSCLESIVSGVCDSRYEIIVVDNNSADGSAGAVAKAFPHVNVVSLGDNLGFARANNIGMRLCSGRYVCLANSDTVVRGDALRALHDFMERRPSVGIVGPRVLNGDLTLQRSFGRLPSLASALGEAVFLERLLKRDPEDGVDTRAVDYVSGCFMMVRAAALADVGMFDESFYFYGEDLDLCRRFRQASWSVRYFPKAEIVHFGGASSANAPLRFQVQFARAQLQLWRKHHAGASLVVYRWILCFHHVLRLAATSIVATFRGGGGSESAERRRRSVAVLNYLRRGVTE